MSDSTIETPKLCSVCRMKSPETTTNYTLISTRHAWRMILDQRPDGRRDPIWFCPKCWQKRRDSAKR